MSDRSGIDADIGDLGVTAVRERFTADRAAIEYERRDLVIRVDRNEIECSTVYRSADYTRRCEIDYRRMSAAIPELVREYRVSRGEIRSALDREIETTGGRVLPRKIELRGVEGAGAIRAPDETDQNQAWSTHVLARKQFLCRVA